MTWEIRLAEFEDVPELERLIPLSVRALQAPYYTGRQMEAALGEVFAVDEQLIGDRTYFVALNGSTIVGCGGWSQRTALFGGHHGRQAVDCALLVPGRDAARVRAFFVLPNWARRGIGRSILRASEEAIRLCGFGKVELAATLAGVPLYEAEGYVEQGRRMVGLKNGESIEIVQMLKHFQMEE